MGMNTHQMNVRLSLGKLHRFISRAVADIKAKFRIRLAC